MTDTEKVRAARNAMQRMLKASDEVYGAIITLHHGTGFATLQELNLVKLSIESILRVGNGLNIEIDQRAKELNVTCQ